MRPKYCFCPRSLCSFSSRISFKSFPCLPLSFVLSSCLAGECDPRNLRHQYTSGRVVYFRTVHSEYDLTFPVFVKLCTWRVVWRECSTQTYTCMTYFPSHEIFLYVVRRQIERYISYAIINVFFQILLWIDSILVSVFLVYSFIYLFISNLISGTMVEMIVMVVAV